MSVGSRGLLAMISGEFHGGLGFVNYGKVEVLDKAD